MFYVYKKERQTWQKLFYIFFRVKANNVNEFLKKIKLWHQPLLKPSFDDNNVIFAL